jgi:hypothetical protein
MLGAVHELLVSLKEFGSKVARHWCAFGLGVIGGLGCLASTLYAEARPKAAPLVPLPVWLLMLTLGFLVAIIGVFHDLRLDRDRLRAEMANRFTTMRYALQFSGISGSVHRGADGALYFKPSIDLTNHAHEYLRYEVEQAIVTIGASSLSATGQPLIIAPNASSAFMLPGLRVDDGAPLQGSLKLVAVYGLPSVPAQYRVRWEFALHGLGAAGWQTARLSATLLGEAAVEDCHPAAA